MPIDPLSFTQFGIAGATLGVMVYLIRLLVKTSQENQQILVKVQNNHAEQLKELNQHITTVVERNTEAINRFSDKIDHLMYIKAGRKSKQD